MAHGCIASILLNALQGKMLSLCALVSSQNCQKEIPAPCLLPGRTATALNKEQLTYHFELRGAVSKEMLPHHFRYTLKCMPNQAHKPKQSASQARMKSLLSASALGLFGSAKPSLVVTALSSGEVDSVVLSSS
jgi:hypothetical protein